MGIVDGVLERMTETMGPKTTVVATGGQARIICSACRYIREIDDNLTLEGLRIIWERNRKGR